MSSRTLRSIFAAVALAFFLTPIALRAVGVRAKDIENSVFAPAPRLSEGWGFFNETTRFLIDRMPLRAQAVRANTWISESWFNTTPRYGLNGLGGVSQDQALPFTGRPAQDQATLGSVPSPSSKASPQPPPTAEQVVVGKDGWLFLQGVFDRACHPFVPFPAAVARWEELLRIIRNSGRQVEMLVPPDKSTVYPEYVAQSTPNLQCSALGERQLWNQIESSQAKQEGIIGLRHALLEAKRSASGFLYMRKDSHWNTYGALTLVENALTRLSPKIGVLPSEIGNPGPSRYTGDLTVLLGNPQSDTTPERSIRRAAEAPVIPGPAVLIGDSYTDVAVGLLRPYFADLQQLYWVNDTTKQLLQGIAAAHTVILETVEREFDYRASNLGYVTPAFLKLLRATLKSNPPARTPSH
jgi:alginate O-acetyltransferase complex protein AlgJ